MKRIFALILACFSLHSFAEEVSGLYTGLVPVVDQSAQSRDLALMQALTQVLVKLTGNSKIMQSSKLQPFLTNPNAFVSGIGFRNIPSADDQEQAGMEVSFDRQALDQVIRQAQLPVLPSNRPTLLVWIVRDDALLGRNFEGLGSDSATLQAFDRAMRSRGMPYVFPNFDLQDQLALSVNEAWSLRADLISPASQRYNTDGWIALRYYTTSSGEVRGAWLYQSAGRRQLNDFRAEAGEEFMPEAVASLVDSLSRFYTYIPQLNTSEFLVRVNGVTSFADYQAVLGQFKKLEVVDSVQLFAVKGGQLTLAVDAEAGADLLNSALLRSGRVEAIDVPEQMLGGGFEYNWISK
ncbi:MAG: DUF2066 domain-containing protein [Porticoccaceae bacterium]